MKSIEILMSMFYDWINPKRKGLNRKQKRGGRMNQEVLNQEQLEELFKKVALDVQDIRKITGAGRDTAYALCKSGKFHAVRVGKNRIKVPTEGFKKWWYGEQQIAQ